MLTVVFKYTADAFTARMGLPCASLSFADIAQGSLPTETYTLPIPSLRSPGTSAPLVPPTAKDEDSQSEVAVEMVICSFALHLIESPSELFSLLWELSTKCRWLVVLAPHKKPEVRRHTKYNQELMMIDGGTRADKRWVGMGEMECRDLVQLFDVGFARGAAIR